MTASPDNHVDRMDHATLFATVGTIRAAIRANRDTSMEYRRCHHPDMWALLPEPPTGKQILPDWPQFTRSCIRYRQSLDQQLADAPRSNREFGE